MIFSRESLYGWGVCDIPMPRLGGGAKPSPEGRRTTFEALASILRRDLLWTETLIFLFILLFFFIGLFFIAGWLPHPEEKVASEDVDITVRLALEPVPEPAPVHIPDVVIPPPLPLVEERVETVVEEPPPPVPLPPPFEAVKQPERVVEPPKPLWRDAPAPPKVDLPKPAETPRRIERERREVLVDSMPLPEFKNDVSPTITVAPELAPATRRVERPSSQLPQQTFDQTPFAPEATAKTLLPPQNLSVKKAPVQKRAEQQALEQGGLAFDSGAEVSLQSASVRRTVTDRREEEEFIAPTVSTFAPSASSGVVLSESQGSSARVYDRKESSGVAPALSQEPLPRLQSNEAQVELNRVNLKKGVSVANASSKRTSEKLRDIDVAVFLQRPVDQVDPGLLVTLNEQRTCLDPAAERPLKARLASLVVKDSAFQGDGMIYYISNADMGDQIQIKILNYGFQELPDRCTLLEGAISSVRNSMK